MRLTKIVLLLIASLAFNFNSFAQGKQLKKAEIAYDQYEFHKAMIHFKRAYSKSSDRPVFHLREGPCCSGDQKKIKKQLTVL